MKKNIFELNRKQFSKVEKEFWKTTYGKIYTLPQIIVAIFGVLSAINAILSLLTPQEEASGQVYFTLDVVIFIIIVLFYFLLDTKRIEMIKNFYETKTQTKTTKTVSKSRGEKKTS